MRTNLETGYGSETEVSEGHGQQAMGSDSYGSLGAFEAK